MTSLQVRFYMTQLLLTGRKRTRDKAALSRPAEAK